MMISRRTRGARARSVLVVLVTALVAASCTQLMIDETVIASDDMMGRQNGSIGSGHAQRYLIDSLKPLAVGLDTSKTGDDAYKQPFPSDGESGTNILAKIPGGQLANEYVVIGAHYDHLGSSCRSADANDIVCNGATDNATGVAVVLEIARLIKAAGTPRRSVILAFWDSEEDGLLGSKYYVEHPIVPNAQSVAYVNFDIQGANLLPTLKTTSFAIGAETGGPRLRTAVANAVGSGKLQTKLLSAIFGQGRSDYVNFTNVGVPNVFFSDANGPCYHTAQDEVDIVDFAKLDLQAKIGYRVSADLIAGNDRPTFLATNPVATFDDAVTLAGVTNSAEPDLGRFTPAQQEQLRTYRDALNAIVAAGPGAFDDADVGTVIAGAAGAVQILATGVCDGFLR